MSEDEAKTKWCPFARVVMDWSTVEGRQPIIGPFNRDHAINSDIVSDVIHRSRCIGSACMAWRRQRFWWPAWTVGEVWDRKTAGYCGLAGRL